MKLIKIEGTLHSFDGQLTWPNPIDLALAVDRGAYIQLRVAPNGYDMLVLREPLQEPVYMAEYGHTEIHDVTERLDPSLREAELDALVSIQDAAERVIGVALIRKQTEPYCIWVDGDELIFGGLSALEAWFESGPVRPKLGGAMRL